MSYTARDVGTKPDLIFLKEEGGTSFFGYRSVLEDAFKYFGQSVPEIKKTSETTVPKKIFELMEEEASGSRSFIK